MRLMRVALAVVALCLVGASSHGAIQRTQPTAKSTMLCTAILLLEMTTWYSVMSPLEWCKQSVLTCDQ